MKLPTYHSLPNGTPGWLTVAIFLLGGPLGIAITVFGLIALYGLSGFLVLFFFPTSGFLISTSEAVRLGIIGVCSGLTALAISYLAVYMNGLSKKAVTTSRFIWIPCAITVGLMLLERASFDSLYSFNGIWIGSTIASLIFAGILPWLLFRTPAARKVHRR